MSNSKRIKIFLVLVANNYDNLYSNRKHRRGKIFREDKNIQFGGS